MSHVTTVDFIMQASTEPLIDDVRSPSSISRIMSATRGDAAGDGNEMETGGVHRTILCTLFWLKRSYSYLLQVSVIVNFVVGIHLPCDNLAEKGG